MGYMGLGMHKWIYSRNPQKKLFEKNRLPLFTPIPRYSRTFKLQSNPKENKLRAGILTVVIIIGFIIVLNYFYNQFTVHSKEISKQTMVTENIKNNQAFEFLLKSGKNRLKENRMLMAYSELKLAQALRPDDEELNNILIETLSIICNNDNKYCNELDTLLKRSN